VAPAVLIPVKSFDLAKGRLAQALSPAERSRLAMTMAERVIVAARPLPTWVVCDSPDVAAFAIGHGAGVIWRRSRGLNAAVDDGVTFLGGEGHRQVIIAHADLPLAQALAWVADFDGVSIVVDRRGDGTNVMAVPTAIDFAFHYGPGSAVAHQAEALRHGCAYRILDDRELGWDVDVPEDLSVLDHAPADRCPSEASSTEEDRLR
jgi:2-phospho-L-lactate/phosphoenolpyruvate guanylyltransferase